MTQIEKYIERLKTLQNLYEEGQPQHNAFGIAIVEANEMLVKNCSIPVVVGQSEQLVCNENELDCPYDFTSRCTIGRCDCKPKAN